VKRYARRQSNVDAFRVEDPAMKQPVHPAANRTAIFRHDAKCSTVWCMLYSANTFAAADMGRNPA